MKTVNSRYFGLWNVAAGSSMRRYALWMASFLILFMTIFPFSSPATADVLFSSNGTFPDNNLVLWPAGSAGTILPIQNDVTGNPTPSISVSSSSTGGSYSYKLNDTASDFVFETDVMFTDTSTCEGFYLLFRYVDPNNFYYLKFSGRYNGGFIIMGKSPDGGTGSLGYVTNQGWSANTWYKIKLVAQGSSLMVYVNDILKIDANDPSYTSGIIGFNTGFYMPSGTVSWYLDNIKLSTIESKIAFYSNRDGNYEIYVMNPDGTNQTRLTNNNVEDAQPSWSPDRTKIVFESDRDGNNEIYVMNADGTNQRRLTTNSVLDRLPRFSPDGTKIAFDSYRDGNFEIYVMNADGTGQTRLTNNPAIDGEPSWSPDGTKIAFASWRNGGSNIFVMNADGSNSVQLTSGRWASCPAWSPDGTKIAFCDSGAIYVMNADGTNQTSILNVGCCISPYVGSWSPDGTKIVLFSDRFDGNFEIYTINSDGTNRTRLTNNSADDYYPSWSPILPISYPTTYSISGRVTENGVGLSGVTMTLDSGQGDLPVATTTEADGTYSFDLSDDNYTITPSLTGYTFTPLSQSITVAGADMIGVDFTATPVSTPSVGVIQLPRTGQMTCYDSAGAMIPCAGTGQDGEIQAGVPWPDPRFTDSGDGTVTDNLTGLMWTKNANLPGTSKTWHEALDYVTGMNAGTYPNFGYTDWRLPNINELESLIDTGRYNPALPSGHPFTNVQGGYYRSSTSIAPYAVQQNIDMYYGRLDYGYPQYVWPVRSGQNGIIQLPKTGQTTSYASGDDGAFQKGVVWPNPRFTDNGDGTVADNLTGLMWTNNANLPGTRKKWEEALDYVKGMNSGVNPNFGYTDWRLPNRKELQSLIDKSRNNPALPLGHPFTNYQFANVSGVFWSSTSYAVSSSSAWSLHMLDGIMVDGGKSGSEGAYVWPVRGGQVEGTPVLIDSDNDGYPDNQDCAPNNPNIYPGAPETCNDKDDNCDNLPDETFIDKGNICYGCNTTGSMVCNQDESGTVCNAGSQPSPEVCDGVDNDCDGVVDEGCNVDQDSDGLTDVEEVTQYHTNPHNPDTDVDGVGDKKEVLDGTDPLDPNSFNRTMVACGLMIGADNITWKASDLWVFKGNPIIEGYQLPGSGIRIMNSISELILDSVGCTIISSNLANSDFPMWLGVFEATGRIAFIDPKTGGVETSLIFGGPLSQLNLVTAKMDLFKGIIELSSDVDISLAPDLHLLKGGYALSLDAGQGLVKVSLHTPALDFWGGLIKVGQPLPGVPEWVPEDYDMEWNYLTDTIHIKTGNFSISIPTGLTYGVPSCAEASIEDLTLHLGSDWTFRALSNWGIGVGIPDPVTGKNICLVHVKIAAVEITGSRPEKFIRFTGSPIIELGDLWKVRLMQDPAVVAGWDGVNKRIYGIVEIVAGPPSTQGPAFDDWIGARAALSVFYDRLLVSMMLEGNVGVYGISFLSASIPMTLDAPHTQLASWEVFIDNNGNGLRDNNEEYIDINENGKWDDRMKFHVVFKNLDATFRLNYNIPSPFAEGYLREQLKILKWELNSEALLKLDYSGLYISGTLLNRKWQNTLRIYPCLSFNLNFIPGASGWCWEILDQGLIIELGSPTNLHVYDNMGRHVGLNPDGTVNLEIPNAQFLRPSGTTHQIVVIPNPDLAAGYRVEVDGTGEGVFDLSVTGPDGTRTVITGSSFSHIPVNPSTHAEAIINTDGVGVLGVDQDGDGTTDESYTAEQLDPIPLTTTLPSLMITEPDGTEDISTGLYKIKWIDRDAQGDRTLSFYYDQDNLGFDGVLIVEGISEADSNNQLVWDTTNMPPGNYYVYGILSDRTGKTASSYSLGKVTVGQSTPRIISLPSQKAFVGAPYAYQVDITNPDGDSVSVALSGYPEGMTMDLLSHTISWVPLIDQIGANQVVLSVEDSQGGRDNQVFDIYVINDETPPSISASISSPPNVAGWHKTDVTVIFTCSDAESGITTCPDPVVISTEGVNQVISGTTYDKAGNSASASVILNIDKTPPILTCPLDTEILAMELTGTPSTYTGIQSFLSGAIANENLDSMVSVVNNAPLFFPIGETLVTFTATDDAGNQSNCQAKVTVTSPKATSNGASSYFKEGGYNAYATFDVKYQTGATTPSGNLTFTSSRYRRKIVSTGIDSLNVSGKTAVFSGSCTMNGYTGYYFTATVGDNATPGSGVDTFSMTVTGPNGFTTYTASGTINSGDYTVSQ